MMAPGQGSVFSQPEMRLLLSTAWLGVMVWVKNKAAPNSESET